MQLCFKIVLLGISWFQAQPQQRGVMNCAVVVELHGGEANVRVMDDINFQRYRSGDGHKYYGGHYRQAPAIIHPPSSGDWNVVIDDAGEVTASVHVAS
jgi:hypothetical protein